MTALEDKVKITVIVLPVRNNSAVETCRRSVAFLAGLISVIVLLCEEIVLPAEPT